jgi:small-conductance mechanosensitive channel
MRKLIILCSLLLIGASIFAQTVPANSAPQPINKSATDSTAHKANIKESKRLRKKMMWAADTLTSSDFMMSIERINDKLNTLRDSSKLGFEVVRMGRHIDDMTNGISLIRQNMGGRRARVHIRNLYLYQNFISDMSDDSKQEQRQLNAMYSRLYRAKLGLKHIMSDSVFRVLCADSSMRKTFEEKLSRLQTKWERTDSITKSGLNSLNALKVKLSDNSINLSNMLNMLDNRLDKLNQQLFGQETNCLWQPTQPDTLVNSTSQTNTSTLASEQRAVSYYFSQTSKQRALVLLIALLLFTWLFLKRRQLKAFRENNATFAFLHLKYLNHSPVLSLLVVLLCLMPFFDAYAPTSYIIIEYLLLLAGASIIFFRQWARSFWITWMALVGCFIAVAITHLYIEPLLFQRLWLMVLHGSIIVFTFRFIKKLDIQSAFYKWIKIAGIVSMTFASLAVISNLFGRFTLSEIFGITSIVAITQAVILPVFIDTLQEVLLLQLQCSRLKKGINRPFDYSIVIHKIKMPLMIIVALIWLTMLTSNLNIYHNISDSVSDLLTTTRTVGSISFKLISVLLFIIIIWCAHILQRLISFMFGETGSETEDVTVVSKGQHSRLLMTRLFVLVGGYLLAVAASGLPIDKITIVLGALGVGIGMGLQNIVNNFVSGVILIFDGSLQIGDEIEVSGQAGKVKEIGLRASTINTADGAEVIIPNGNILSQNIVNWTFSNDQRRVMIEISLTGEELDANVISELINKTISAIPHVIGTKKPVILFSKVKPGACVLTIRFWSTTTHIEQVKSVAMIQLNAAFAAQGITME